MVVSELDYAYRGARLETGIAPDRCRAWMLRTERWKYVYFEGFRGQLFDLRDDPQELHDRGGDAALKPVRDELDARLFAWLRGRKIRATVTIAEVVRRVDGAPARRPIIIGEW